MINQYSVSKQLIDQSAHAFVSILILCLFAYSIHTGYMIAGGALCGLGLGLIREITEEGEVTINAFINAFQGFSNLIDLSGWTLGGFIAGLIVHFV